MKHTPGPDVVLAAWQQAKREASGSDRLQRFAEIITADLLAALETAPEPPKADSMVLERYSESAHAWRDWFNGTRAAAIAKAKL